MISLMKKSEARSFGQQARRDLPLEIRKERSKKICEALMPLVDQVETIGCYVSIKEEVDTREIIEYCWKKKKKLCVPKTVGNTLEFQRILSWDDLKEGSFHVLEPITNEIIDIEEIDLLIVPLSVFDHFNNRCGYGKGFYDSILKKCKKSIGVAYKEQQVDHIETEAWDVKVDDVIFR